MLHALDDDELAEAFAPPQHVMNHRHDRCAAEAACHEHDIASADFLQRPAASERSAQSHPIARFECGQPPGDASQCTDGMADEIALFRIRHDGNRDFADAVEIQHVELAGRKTVGRLRGCIIEPQLQREDGRRLLDARQDGGGMRRAGIETVRHVHGCLSVRAATSSVRSMPTGHQAMQRPQPTQPLRPNWSCQVASLWVSHWR